jgi:methylated-DNA-[protein]-cysteine S-methyltransferase
MLFTAVIYTKFGKFEITGSEKGIRRLRKAEEDAPITEDLPKVLQKCAQQLNAYFAGKLKKFNLKLDWSEASEFNIKVWEVLLTVPYGHTISYGAIAKLIGQPKAYQAVGLANKHNPIAIVVPCHRCIGKDGDLTGYFYGLEMKQELLRLENPMSFAIQGKLF